MDKELRDALLIAARANGAKHGKLAELDFGAGAEWMYDKLKSSRSLKARQSARADCIYSENVVGNFLKQGDKNENMGRN